MVNEPYINQELLNKVLRAKEDELLHDDSFKVWDNDGELKEDLTIQQKRDLSELSRILQNFSKEEIAVVVLVAIQNYPEMVFQLMMEEYLTNKETRKDGSNS